MKSYKEFTPIANVETVKNKSGVFYNSPCAFDIETTSYYTLSGEKRATMYIWQMSVFGENYYGRTYDDMLLFFKTLKKAYCKNGEKIIVYVHNLAYDSHFILKWLNVNTIFATDKHEPLYFEHDNFLIFKCSLRLSGKKLAHLADGMNIEEKITGYDYSKIRHCKTFMTDDELLYCETDINIVYHFICEEIKRNHNDITQIPYTLTGYARRYCRNKCLRSVKYSDWFKRNTPTDPELYKMLRQAFTGGITHANAIHCDVTVENVTNYDLQSDYPAQIVKNKYPSTPFMKHKIDKFPEDEKTAVIAEVMFYGLKARYTHSVLSVSKCFCLCPVYKKQIYTCRKCPLYGSCPHGLYLDNGRIIQCGNVTTTITEIDFEYLKLMYEWDSYKIIKSYVAKKDYLPREFVLATLQLYADKTRLKDLPGYEIDYKLSKGLLNSLYGMCVTDIVHDFYNYTPDNDEMWTEEKNVDIAGTLLKYQNNYHSFLLYQTGVYITAFARRDLVTVIANICNLATDSMNGKPFDDILYYDTDSIKLINGDKYKKVFEEFNLKNRADMANAADYHNIKFQYFEPTDKNGNKRLLGIFDTEKPYTRFKTLGAKRYVYEYADGTFHITIAGVNKDTGAAYMKKLAAETGTGIFDIFDDELFFPEKYCGKKALYYSDTGFTEILTDYNGKDCVINERAFIHMCDTSYSLSIADDFKHLFTNYKNWGI